MFTENIIIVDMIFLQCNKNYHLEMKEFSFITFDGRMGHIDFKQQWPQCEGCVRTIHRKQTVGHMFNWEEGDRTVLEWDIKEWLQKASYYLTRGKK